MTMTYGPCYNEARDRARLTKQRETILAYMLDGQWRTLSEISAALHYGEASISAQLRHLTRVEHGGWIKTKRYIGNGLFEYRMTYPMPNVQLRML